MKIALGFRFIPAVMAFAVVGLAQNPDQPKPQIRSLSHAIHAVEDLDTTLAFYRDVFGLNGMPSDFPNPAVPLLTDAPGVTLRLSMMRLPGAMQFELTHFKGTERKPARAKYTDPGAASIVLYVRDIDAAVANAKKANAPIVTTGGEPVEITTARGKVRSILMRDPDGFFVQVIQKRPRRVRRKAMSIASRSLIRWRAPRQRSSFTTGCWAWNSWVLRRSRKIPRS